jgi:integrase
MENRPRARRRERFQAQVAPDERQPRRRPAVAAGIMVTAYHAEFLKVHGVTLRARTVALHRDQFRRYIEPAFGRAHVRSLQRSQIKRWLADLLRRGLDRDTVRIAYAALHVMLNHAVEDEIISVNPASKLGRSLKLLSAPGERQRRVKAMTREQLAAFLAVMSGPEARPADRRYYPFFLTLCRTGLRLGEAFALQDGDLDFTRGILRIERAFSDGRLEAMPKNVSSIRDVDLSPALVAVLRRHLVERKKRALRHGWTAPWVFLSEAGTPLTKQNVERAVTRIVQRAGLSHFTSHDLRHTFASLLLQRGESPKYVQQQLGHTSLSMTTDLYGQWLRAEPIRGGVGALDEVPGVTIPGDKRPTRRLSNGAADRIRTGDVQLGKCNHPSTEPHDATAVDNDNSASDHTESPAPPE